MPGSNRYFVPSYAYHLTHRCHNREFLLRFAKDRDRYRMLLREAVLEFGVSLLDCRSVGTSGAGRSLPSFVQVADLRAAKQASRMIPRPFCIVTGIDRSLSPNELPRSDPGHQSLRRANPEFAVDGGFKRVHTNRRDNASVRGKRRRA